VNENIKHEKEKEKKRTKRDGKVQVIYVHEGGRSIIKLNFKEETRHRLLPVPNLGTLSVLVRTRQAHILPQGQDLQVRPDGRPGQAGGGDGGAIPPGHDRKGLGPITTQHDRDPLVEIITHYAYHGANDPRPRRQSGSASSPHPR